MSEHFVYLISVTGLIKIGHSRDPKLRMRELQVGQGLSLALHATYAMPREQAINVERRTHSILAKHRRRGEWFACSSKDGVAAIKQAIMDNSYPPLTDSSGIVTVNVKNIDKPAWQLAKRSAAKRKQSMGAYLSETIYRYDRHLRGMPQIPYRPRAPIHNGSTEPPPDSVDNL